jgi:hypothetical protein
MAAAASSVLQRPSGQQRKWQQHGLQTQTTHILGLSSAVAHGHQPVSLLQEFNCC